jgi:hypothetical protein
MAAPMCLYVDDSRPWRHGTTASPLLHALRWSMPLDTLVMLTSFTQGASTLGLASELTICGHESYDRHAAMRMQYGSLDVGTAY